MNNRDVFEIDEKRYEELVKIAEAQLDYEKKELLENGGNEDDYYFTYRIYPNNEEYPFCLYILSLSSYKEMSTEELKLKIDEFTEELEDLQLELEDLQLEFEDLKNGWDKTLFTTEKEYWENFYEIEDEIFTLETNISLCEKFIKEKSK